MRVRTLWIVVAVIWTIIAVFGVMSPLTYLFGLVWCAVLAWRGKLAGKHGIRR